MKKCNKCNQEKPFECFRKDSREKDGYRYTCTECLLGRLPHEKATIEKLCKKCNTIKPLDSFGFVNKKKNLKNSDCKQCKNKTKTEKLKNTGVNKIKCHKKRLNKYHITQIEFNLLLTNQNNKCKICATPFIKTPHIDHCHITGVVRGLLCHGCNIALGGFRNNIESLKSAILYLEQST